MAGTYTKINLHIVFAVKNRTTLLPKDKLSDIFAYMSATLLGMGHYYTFIGGVEDHVHILLTYNPAQDIPQMIRELKTATTKMINRSQWLGYPFCWQRGYSIFSHSESQVEAVKRYIENQELHHTRFSYKDEIRKAYENFGVKYDEKYAFEEG